MEPSRAESAAPLVTVTAQAWDSRDNLVDIASVDVDLALPVLDFSASEIQNIPDDVETREQLIAGCLVVDGKLHLGPIWFSLDEDELTAFLSECSPHVETLADVTDGRRAAIRRRDAAAIRARRAEHAHALVQAVATSIAVYLEALPPTVAKKAARQAILSRRAPTR
jgi:hypothetical protein